jgi:predicted PurR-regulated permease PerM
VEAGNGLSQWDNMRDNLRRAYESGLDSVRQARAEARASEGLDDDDELTLPPVRPLVVIPSSAEDEDLDVPRGLRVAAAWTWRLVLLALAGVGVLWVIAQLQVVVVPLLIATLLSALLSPLVSYLRRAGLPRSLATLVVMVGGLAAVGGTLYLVINQFILGAPALGQKASDGINKIQAWTRNGPLHLTQQQLNDLGKELTQWFTNHRETLTTGALSTAGTLTEILAGLFLVLFTTFFFLRDGRRISRFMISLLPDRAQGPLFGAADGAWSTLVSYVRATVLVAFIDAVGIGIAIGVLRVPLAFPLIALVFLGAFIPIVGATVSGAVAVLVALVTKDPVTALILLLAVIAVQQFEGHVLQPLIMGRAVAIHPLVVILAIAVGVVLGGIIGALVAVPTVAVLNTAIRHLAAARRAEAAGTDPPPTPPTGPPEPGHP